MASSDHRPTDGERFEEFVGLISSLEKEVQRIRAVECERLGLRGADLMCLYCLGRSDSPLTAAELSRRAGVTRAAVSRSLAQLEEGGLVIVAPAGEQGRAYRAPVSLTDAGRKTMAGVEGAVSRTTTPAPASTRRSPPCSSACAASAASPHAPLARRPSPMPRVHRKDPS